MHSGLVPILAAAGYAQDSSRSSSGGSDAGGLDGGGALAAAASGKAGAGGRRGSRLSRQGPAAAGGGGPAAAAPAPTPAAQAANLNMRGAVIHCIGDLVQSIGVCIAGALIWWQQVRTDKAGVGGGLLQQKLAGRALALGVCRRWQPVPAGHGAAGAAWGSTPPPPPPTACIWSPLSFASQAVVIFSTCLLPCPAAAGRPALGAGRPHLHLPVCRPGAVDHGRHQQGHYRRADGARAEGGGPAGLAEGPGAGGTGAGGLSMWQRVWQHAAQRSRAWTGDGERGAVRGSWDPSGGVWSRAARHARAGASSSHPAATSRSAPTAQRVPRPTAPHGCPPRRPLQVPGVAAVTDLHVWALTPGTPPHCACSRARGVLRGFPNFPNPLLRLPAWLPACQARPWPPGRPCMPNSRR